MGTNEDLRFDRMIKARIRLKLVESKIAIQSGQWIERDKAILAINSVKHDVGDTLDTPPGFGRAGLIDRERDEYDARCDAFGRIGERIAYPPLPGRPTLDPELAEVEAKLAEVPDNVTMLGLRAHVIERQRTLAKRIEATLPREWCAAVVAVINAEVAKFTGREQTGTLPVVEPDAGFIRKMGCREG